MKVYELLNTLSSGCHIGRHSIWLPKQTIKIPFQFAGKACKYRLGTTEGGAPALPSVAEEMSILTALAKVQMAPPIGDIVFFESVISEHMGPGILHHDPVGAYGYEMVDATTLPPGRFDLAYMKSLPISGSPGAWNDINKPGNVVNGYLVDVRRTWWDMLRWDGDVLTIPPYSVDTAKLRDDVTKFCQFPPGERSLPYQEYWLEGAWQEGSRSVRERAAALEFSPSRGDAVLDIGCQSGGFLQLAALNGADRIAGVDSADEYIECARRLARAAQHNIHYQKMDASQAESVVAWARRYFSEGVDHLLLLSIDKHIGEPALWKLVDGIAARTTYIETSAQRENTFALRNGVEFRGGRYLGDSTDRNVRRLYRLERSFRV